MPMLTFFMLVLYFSHEDQNEAGLKIKCPLAKRGAAKYPQHLNNSTLPRHPIQSVAAGLRALRITTSNDPKFCRPLEQFQPAKEDKDRITMVLNAPWTLTFI